MRNPAGRLREAIVHRESDILVNSALEARAAIFGWRRQLPALARTALLLFLPAALLLSVALVQRWVAIPVLFRDVTVASGAPFYAGLYSQLGALFWCSAAAICLFSWTVIRRESGTGDWPAFLLAGGGLSAILLIDDMFLFHDAILPMLISRPQLTTYLFYLIASVAFFLRFRRIILRTDYLILLTALAFLGISAGIDSFAERLIGDQEDALLSYRVFFEDGSKFMGIVAWLAYFAGTCAKRMTMAPGGADRLEA